MNVIAHMIDCATPLTAANCAGLKAAGVSYVGRYLGYKSRGWTKGLTPEEVSIIHAHGLGIGLIWEGDPVNVDYFSVHQGYLDAQGAMEDLVWLGAPTTTPTFATVDYDAIAGDMGVIRAYYAAFASGLKGRKDGIYGGTMVMDNVSAHAYWQACGWSSGVISVRANIYQATINQTVAGVQVDLDDVYSDPGFWMPPVAKQTAKPSNTLYDTGYNAGIDAAIAAIGKLRK